MIKQFRKMNYQGLLVQNHKQHILCKEEGIKIINQANILLSGRQVALKIRIMIEQLL